MSYQFRIATSQFLGCVFLLHALACPVALAQFVPGHVFVVDPTTNHCETDDYGIPFQSEFIYEINPETGESRIFAIIPRELCGGLNGMAMSPDGKRLRVASFRLSVIWEFDSQGNRTIALDSTDGIVGPGGRSCMAYDRHGYFYVSSYFTSEVLRFPPDGGPPTVLANYQDDGVSYPAALSVGPSGEVYVTSGVDTDVLVRIGPDGQVSVFDTFPASNDDLQTVIVDDLGRVFVRTGLGPSYRYEAGDPESREVFPLRCEFMGNICVESFSLSPDRKTIYAAASYPRSVVSVSPDDASFEMVAPLPHYASSCGLGVVPLRSDVDGDGNSDAVDVSLLMSCLRGPSAGPLAPQCDLADMDADGDVDLFDVRFFLWAHSALQD